MEGDSQEEDATLRDYWTKKKEKKKEVEEKKKEKEKRERERRSVSGEAKFQDKEAQEKHKGSLLDSTKLTTLTSVDEGTLHISFTSEEIPISSHYNSDDNLRDFNDFESETASPNPPIQSLQDEDVDMEGVSSPNQSEFKGQDISSQVSNSNSPNLGSSSHQVHPVDNHDNTSLASTQENTSLAPPQEVTSLALPHEVTSILTVDILNDIVEGGRSASPIRDHTSDGDFFNIKEQRYLQHMQKFRNGDGSYTISHPIAISLLLALETEQRSKNFIKAQNEYQLAHMKNIVESATFAVQIRDEVTANITKTIVDKLKGPVEDSRRQIENYTEAILRRVNDSEAQLENQKVHRVGREFLSRTREEHTSEVLGHKITVLTESNEELKAERDNFEKTSIGAQQLVAKLKEEKALWQKKYLHLLEGSKRPREDDSDHEQSKRRSQSRSVSTLEESSSSTLVVQPSNISGETSARKSSKNTSESDTTSNSRAQQRAQNHLGVTLHRQPRIAMTGEKRNRSLITLTFREFTN
jgi:hypothetical protein